jgi:hypothetical protein
MGGMGLLGDTEYHFCHTVLHDRNILVEIPEDWTVRISGLLAWDTAIFVPKFLSCAPPMWIWLSEEDDGEDEALAEKTPDHPGGKELKQVFEDTVGPGFLQYVYKLEYHCPTPLRRSQGWHVPEF